MHKAVTNNEVYVGLNWLAKQLNLHRYKVHYWAVKQRTRTFKFKGVRYIELLDTIELVKKLEVRFGIPDELTEPLKQNLEQRKSQGGYEV
jgi:hypothetical protein